MNSEEFRAASEAIEKWPNHVGAVLVLSAFISEMQHAGILDWFLPGLKKAVAALAVSYPSSVPVIERNQTYLCRAAEGSYTFGRVTDQLTAHQVTIRVVEEFAKIFNDNGATDCIQLDSQDDAFIQRLIRISEHSLESVFGGNTPITIPLQIRREREKAISAMQVESIAEALTNTYVERSVEFVAKLAKRVPKTIIRRNLKRRLPVHPDDKGKEVDFLRFDRRTFDEILKATVDERDVLLGGKRRHKKCRSLPLKTEHAIDPFCTNCGLSFSICNCVFRPGFGHK